MNHPKYFTYHGSHMTETEDGEVHITHHWTDSQGNDRSWSECRRRLGNLRFSEPKGQNMANERYLKTRIKEKLFRHDALWAFDYCWVQFLMNGKWVLEANGGWIFG